MARSAALNPASMPFFPGSSLRSPDPTADAGPAAPVEHGRNGSPAFFTNPFQQDEEPRGLALAQETRLRASPALSAVIGASSNGNGGGLGQQQQQLRQSPTIRSGLAGASAGDAAAGKPYPTGEARSIRDTSILGSLSPLPENEDSPITDDPEELAPYASGQQTPSTSFYNYSLQNQRAQQEQQEQQHKNQLGQIEHQQQKLQQQLLMAAKERERNNSIAQHIGNASVAPGYTSASPVSSIDSKHSRASMSVERTPSFEEQLKASPLFRDVLSRLVQVEYTTREIQRDVSDINRKVNMLVDRALNPPVAPPPVLTPQHHQHPEFQDPFATNSSTSTLSVNNHLRPRPSIGNIAPNQPANGEDISSISQQLSTLTSSVGHLLALQQMHVQGQQQQQQHGTPTIPESRNNSVITLGGNGPGPLDLAPNQILQQHQGGGGLNGLNGMNNGMGNGLPNRPGGMRQPNAPLRTLSWSPGIMQDLPVRPMPLEQQQLQQNMSRPGPQRRSVSSLLRRDSSGVIDPQGDGWAGGAGGRDNGPVISKWEQLALAPELLRSLGQFGLGPPNKIQQRALPFLLRGSDIIAQAPPTQERIAAYVIPAIQVAVTNLNIRLNKGPLVVMVSTTVDQATQAQRMIRDLGSKIGVKSALGVGTSTASTDITQELRILQSNMPHIICGTPQKLHALFTAPGGLSGAEVRFLVLDEVDQLIARNLHEFVFNIVKLLPPPRSRPISGTASNATSPATPSVSSATSSTTPQMTFTSPFEPGNPIIPSFSPSSVAPGSGRRFSAVPSPSPGEQQQSSGPSSSSSSGPLIERQTAIFSNTVPQDVLNLANQIHLREPVRVLVRRDGNVSSVETSQGSRGLRQYYLYLAFTANARSDPMASTAGGGLGIIGSGRSASSAETTQAREWKLDALVDILDDVEVAQVIIHVGGMTALETVVYKLANKGIDSIPLHAEMNTPSRVAALTKFRSPASSIMRQAPSTKALVIYDVQLKNNEVPHVPLVINYDLPKAVEEYSHRVSSAIASNYSRPGVVVNFVTATGGDVEMLRSIECFYKIKCPEVPTSLRDIL